jgi:Immunity protein Imm1
MPIHEISTPEQLDEALSGSLEDNLQLQVSALDGSSLSAFFVGERAWLMYLRYYGDSGFSSRNPEYAGDPESVLEFTLDNGQVDEFPASWFYPRHHVENTLRQFCTHQKQPLDISWYED